MGMVDGFIRAAEEGLGWAVDFFGKSFESYAYLETKDDNYTLAAKDGSLVSVLRVDGVIANIGAEEFERICTMLSRSLRSYLKDPGHSIDFSFEFDPENGSKIINRVTQQSYATIKNLGLDAEYLLNAKREHLPRYCHYEHFYIAVWTRPTILAGRESSDSSRRQAQKLRKHPQGGRCEQNLHIGLDALRQRHQSLMAALKADLVSIKFLSETLTAHEICHVIRSATAPEFTGDNWRAVLPGDPIRPVVRSAAAVSEHGVGYEPLGWQLFPQSGSRVGRNYLEIGDRLYAPIDISRPPIGDPSFSELFSKLLNSGIPYRISFKMDGGGQRFMGIKRIGASLLSWASKDNVSINEATDSIDALTKAGEAFVRMRISLCTWAPRGDEMTLRGRVARLAKFVTGWGSSDVNESTGDVVFSFLSTVPAFMPESTANWCVGPISEVVRILPVSRTASAWQSGGVIYRTLDGKPVPFQPGSPMQTTWNYIFFALPGSGKSVQISTILMASCFEPGIRRLPRIGLMDIGPSSRGFVEAIWEALPDHQKHYAAHYRLSNTIEYAVNPFDTQLGCRDPLPEDRGFLVDLLTLLASPPEKLSEPLESISQVAAAVVDEMYSMCRDDEHGRPKRYTPGTVIEVDEKLALYNVLDQPDVLMMTWWEIVDFLYDKNDIHEAMLAQRHAVPVMADAATAARAGAVEDQYGSVTVPTGETLNHYFSRMVSDTVRSFPILSEPTRFDLGDVRICSLDIEEIAKEGGPQMRHQAAIAYMVAMFILTRHYRLRPEVLASIPTKYHSYHAERVRSIGEDMKYVVLDEFHRTSAAPSVRNTVLTNMREGRKWKMSVMLASQSIEDFNKTMVEFATSIFVMKANNTQNADELQQLFGFNETAKHMLLAHCHGPTEAGAPFLGIFRTKLGDVTQVLVNTISPIETWTFSTTSEDRSIREIVFAEFGKTKGRRILAHCYPGGSAAKEVLKIKEQENSALDGGGGAINIVANGIIKKGWALIEAGAL